MRNRWMTVFLSVMSGLILVGCGFTAYMLHYTENRENIIKVKMDESASSSVEFRALDIAPGDTVEYTLELTSELEGACTLSVDFQEMPLEDAQKSVLKEYLYVTVEIDGTVLCDDLLKDVYDLPAMTETCTLDSKESLQIKILYRMPGEIGNEAQNAKASFDIALRASSE